MFHPQTFTLIEAPEHEFAERFAAVWQSPTPETLCSLLDDYVVLRQPHRPVIVGKEAALSEFRRLLNWLPDLHGIVDRASYAPSLVMIEWRMIVPVGMGSFTLHAVDRLTLSRGLATERAVYFDTAALLRQMMQHPKIWRGYLRYRHRPLSSALYRGLSTAT